MAVNTENYRVNILGWNETPEKHVALSARFDGDAQWTELPKKPVTKGMAPLFKCKCGSTEFSDNGRKINEYECPCCFEFVEIELAS